MEDVIEVFDERVREVDLYLSFVKSMHQKNAFLCIPKRQGKKEQAITLEEDLTAMMKANIFIILYNLVESSVRDGMLSVYEAIKDEDCGYQDVSINIKNLWSRYQFKQAHGLQSSWESYFSKLQEMTKVIVESSVVELDRNAIPVSGNLNATQVRKVCDLHGIETTVYKRAKGGRSLETIKDRRNTLAHGHLSFAECGRDFDIEQIEILKKETVIYIKCILNNMSKYKNNKGYLK